jgi:RNA polymerase sigma-70 factor (ECF subfamily)
VKGNNSKGHEGQAITMMDSKLMTQPTADEKSTATMADHVANLFERHHEAIFAYLYRLLDDAEWAHDLTQETFLRLFRTRRRLAAVENERAWIYRIASNLAFNALKRRRRFAWLPWREGDATPADVQLREDDPARRIQKQVRVAEALATLSPTYRAPLLLYSHFDFSVREVAEALSISEGAVKTRLFRAREMFREAYGQWE